MDGGHQNGQVGLISLRWDWNLAQEGIKSIQSLLKNSTRLLDEDDVDDKDDKARMRDIAETLTKTNVTWASFCTEMVHPTPNTQVKSIVSTAGQKILKKSRQNTLVKSNKSKKIFRDSMKFFAVLNFFLVQKLIFGLI